MTIHFYFFSCVTVHLVAFFLSLFRSQTFPKLLSDTGNTAVAVSGQVAGNLTARDNH